ncbi:hypothetical protein [Pseudomonas fragi]|uniref:Uncharacterized protein n=1 Tax=Pseudomonas fragi TaxID=296 RepID=A0A9Q5FNM3_PSEFR|nr:hypothetical protein [Pseudomonas fragi]NNB49521.1 hypothetical protein [Pseudomonas fragi]
MIKDYLREEFDRFASKVAQLHQHKAQVNKIYTEQHQSIQKFHGQLPDWALESQYGIKHYFHFRSPSTGEDLSHDSPPLSLEDRLELNVLQKLKTYQWLLVEAYEAFEDFLERAYAYCGLAGISIWVRPVKWSHEGSNDIKHYHQLPTPKDRKPYAQLQAFRRASKHFERYESENPTGANYRVILVLIEKLRHFIVHDGGYYNDAGTLAGKVQRELPGMDIKSVMGFVNSFFIPHAHSQIVDLLEYPADPKADKPLGTFHDPMLGFFRNLIEYGLLIFETIQMQREAEKR